MKKQPTSITAAKNQRKHEKEQTDAQVYFAMEAASDAIDILSADRTRLTAENVALRKIIIGERGEAIYYRDKYLAFVKRECVEFVPIPFRDLPEAEQESYVKKAILELECEEKPAENKTLEMPKKVIIQ
jgi:hypothetical protein